MKARRRRRRRRDPLASPAAVRHLLDQLRGRCPHLIPKSEKHLLRLLEAVRHVERRPSTDTRRGRPGRFLRQDLIEVARHLRCVLQRETGGRISLLSFTGQYLRLLDFPSDVTTVLQNGGSTFRRRPN